jgi:N6-L-threonylcarbamoyladenine synthase
VGGRPGVHCSQSLGDYVRLGSTLDDAVGEAFDKVARDLELPWMVDGVPSAPGAALEALASKGVQAFCSLCGQTPAHAVTPPICAGDASKIEPPLPIPMRAKPSQRTHCDFSFAGLKAAVKRRVQAEDPLPEATRANLAAAFQEAAISHIVDRLDRGLRWCQPSSGAAWAAPVAPRCLVVSGGVGSNAALRAACVTLGRLFWPAAVG